MRGGEFAAAGGPSGWVVSFVSMWRSLLRKTGFAPGDTAAVPPAREPGQSPALRAAVLEEVLREHVDSYGAEDPRTIAARNNLASKYAQIGRRQAAVAEFERALADAETVHGPDHPQTDVIRENLAWSYEDAGRADDAAEQWEALLKHRDSQLGPVAADTVTARSRLANCYRKCGRYDAAIAHYERAVEDAGTPAAREDLRIGLSQSYTALGRHDDAAQQLRMVLAQRRRRLGSKHLDTLVIQHRLGRTQLQGGRGEEAVDTLRAAYLNGLSAAGDPEIRMLTLRMRRDLAGALSAQGRHRDAAALF
ncbi:tetratricopeptide repeat protein [Streptomonospora halotolerans]|nr:tetratricopeptide repeat protein [Streptomonospora nanhaiensis]